MYLISDRTAYGDKPHGTVIDAIKGEESALLRAGFKPCDKDGRLLEEAEGEMKPAKPVALQSPKKTLGVRKS